MSEYPEFDHKITLGREYNVETAFTDFNGEAPSEVQKAAFEHYKAHLDEYLRKIPNVLLDYFVHNYKLIKYTCDSVENLTRYNVSNEDVVKLIKIKKLYIDEKGAYAFLCDCAWDVEHGISIVLVDKYSDKRTPYITDQDYLY